MRLEEVKVFKIYVNTQHIWYLLFQHFVNGYYEMYSEEPWKCVLGAIALSSKQNTAEAAWVVVCCKVKSYTSSFTDLEH